MFIIKYERTWVSHLGGIEHADHAGVRGEPLEGVADHSRQVEHARVREEGIHARRQEAGGREGWGRLRRPRPAER